MSGLGSQIGDIFYTLYNAFINQIIPAMQSFVALLFAPLEQIVPDIPGLGFIGGFLDIIELIFGDFSLFELMIGGGLTLYVFFTVFRFVWGTTDYIT